MSWDQEQADAETRVDRFEVIDKTTPDQPPYPPQWTARQRLVAYWHTVSKHIVVRSTEQWVHVLADAEGDRARHDRILTEETDNPRTQAMLAASAAGWRGEGGTVCTDCRQIHTRPDPAPKQLACPWCRADPGFQCVSVETRLALMHPPYYHDSRIEAARRRVGLDMPGDPHLLDEAYRLAPDADTSDPI